MLPNFGSKKIPEPINASIDNLPLKDRVLYITQWMKDQSRVKQRYMIYLVMYDIENNKIRTHIAKYLIKKGCIRIQKSVYVTRCTSKEIKHLKTVLYEVNGAYKNHDSIIVLPVPQDQIHNMKIIGKNISFEMVVKPKNVLVF